MSQAAFTKAPRIAPPPTMRGTALMALAAILPVSIGLFSLRYGLPLRQGR